MSGFVDGIIADILRPANAERLDDAVLCAGFLFEKARGLAPCGWPDDITSAELDRDDIPRLTAAVRKLLAGEIAGWGAGAGAWALGKLCDRRQQPVLVQALRTCLHQDEDVYEIMVALSNLGERAFGGRTSTSCLETAENRAMAERYLWRVDARVRWARTR